MKRVALFAMLAGVFAVAACTPAFAHSVKIFATPEGRHISGVAYIPGSAPLRQATVQVFTGADSSTLLTTVATDTEGRFAFPRPPQGDLLLVVELPDGHRAEWRIQDDTRIDTVDPSPELSVAKSPGAETPPAPIERAAPDERLHAIERQLHELAVQLEKHDATVRLHDLLGGIGYLVGIAGIAFYVKAIRERRTGTRSRPT